ncbi:MAG: alpha/beta hydrolase, partial [Planctomycetes bacterium]|nr:alpha/beta hydrolase [Planctomycetota bacterium]
MMKAARILCIPALWFVLTGCDQQAKTSSDTDATVDSSNPNGTPPPVVANDGDAKDQESKADDSASTNDDPATQNDRPDPAKDNSPEPPDAIPLDNQAFETQLNKFRSFQEQGKFFEARKLVRSMQRDFADPARARELKEIEFQLKQLIREADGLEVAVISLAAVDINEFQAARRLLKQGGEAGRILLRQIIRESDEARKILACHLDQRYGDGPNMTLDIFPLSGSLRPILIFFHGGYWRVMDKEQFAFPAIGLNESGVLFVSINYALAPSVSLDDIVEQCRQAVIWVYRNAEKYGGDTKRIHVSGHSAGGHLTAMMLSTDWAQKGLPAALLASGITISGIFDLFPI